MPSIVSSQGESDFAPLAAGTHIGRCYQVVNIGLQSSGPWDPKNKHYIAFEVVSERVTWTDKEKVEHEGPAIIGSRYTSSLSPKAILRQHLESWRGQRFTDAELAAFDLFDLVGAPALISVVHSEDGKFANISSLMRLPKGMVCPPAELPPVAYDPSDANAQEAFAALTQRMQETVLKGQQAPEDAAPRQAPATGGVYVPQPLSENLLPGSQVHRDRRNGTAALAPPPPALVDDFDDEIPF